MTNDTAVKKELVYPKAFFVHMPFRGNDLLKPYHSDDAVSFAIEKTIFLSAIDYENFITDLCVDRWFIENNAGLCHVDDDGIWHCILVKRRNRDNGILVMSDGRAFPLWAAYMRKKLINLKDGVIPKMYPNRAIPL